MILEKNQFCATNKVRLQFSELKEMKSAKSNNNNVKQKYEKVAQQDDTSEIVIFQSNRKVSVSFFC